MARFIAVTPGQLSQESRDGSGSQPLPPYCDKMEMIFHSALMSARKFGPDMRHRIGQGSTVMCPVQGKKPGKKSSRDLLCHGSHKHKGFGKRKR